jgi:hypothetical protein
MSSRIYLIVLVLALIAITCCAADCYAICETEYPECLKMFCGTEVNCLQICEDENQACKESC